MRQRLYAFGLKHDTRRPAPAPIHAAHSIRVLWAAWCDAVIACSGDGRDGGGGGEEPRPWDLEYIGTGLATRQKESLARDGDLKRACPLGEAVFFGTAMHHGLRGYVVVKTGNEQAEAADQKVVLFGTDVDVENGVPDVQTYSLDAAQARITHVEMDSEACVWLYTQSRAAVGESVMRFADLSRFRQYLAAGSIDAAAQVTPLPYSSRDPPQCVANATTTTAVDDGMRVWTSTRDPRYPKCLGRSYQGGFDIAPLPYLSESCVTKIAAGGYMSAAVSLDGELFLWGQACPGSEGELDVLKADGSGGEHELVTGVGVDGEQDDLVKCLDVRIDGQEAKVYDVAVGHGHVLVAAEVCGTGGETKRVLFAAGDNSRNQLGLGSDAAFKETFEEITSLRGKRIAHLAAAGWTSYVVSLEG